MIVEGSNFPPPAPAGLVALLRKELPAQTPPDYFDFLMRSDGGQIWFRDAADGAFDCLRIYSVSRMLELRGSLTKLFPSLTIIGGDQGSQYLGYDMSAGIPWPIVILLPGSGSTSVAASFTELAERYFLSVGKAVVE